MNTTVSVKAAPASGQLTKSSLGRLSGWRKVKDSLANFTITAGGMGVLLSYLVDFLLFIL